MVIENQERYGGSQMSFINKELYENADSQRKATQITWEIADCLHQVGAPTYNAFPLIPYAGGCNSVGRY